MLGTKFSVSFKEKFPKVPRQRRQRPLGLEVENQIDRFFLFSCLHRSVSHLIVVVVTTSVTAWRPPWRQRPTAPDPRDAASKRAQPSGPGPQRSLKWNIDWLKASPHHLVCLNEKVTNRLFGGVLYLMPGSHSSTNINENANFKPVKSRPRAAEMRPGKATISCPVYQALFATYIVALCIMLIRTSLWRKPQVCSDTWVLKSLRVGLYEPKL